MWTLVIFASPTSVPFYCEVHNFLLGKCSPHFVSSFGEGWILVSTSHMKGEETISFFCLTHLPSVSLMISPRILTLGQAAQGWKGWLKLIYFGIELISLFLPQTLTEVLTAFSKPGPSASNQVQAAYNLSMNPLLCESASIACNQDPYLIVQVGFSSS